MQRISATAPPMKPAMKCRSMGSPNKRRKREAPTNRATMTLSACFSKTPRLISWTLDPERHSPNSPGPLVTVGRAAAGWSGIGRSVLRLGGARSRRKADGRRADAGTRAALHRPVGSASLSRCLRPQLSR
jgi:hypothetical protein